ncbi:hypothetical protein CFOL_v3_12468 [Cephalotus follicularis]|uniref:Mitochondrial protein n=1 Tax=Cephalotus follicularis TaxID=3775 RepID=A0A1Q3BLW6_CEPFO|nr:hypothetical protein CFOL_v3_12468 [Cephalotus follicularis]
MLNMLKRTNMLGAKPIPTLTVSNLCISKTLESSLPNPTEYRRFVGALQYATLTHPDIAFAVNKACQFMSTPTDLIRYIKSTLSLGLHITTSYYSQLSAFSDADWADCLDDRKSTGAYLIYHGPNLIPWQTRKQDTVARSSTESEYRALALATTKFTWL